MKLAERMLYRLQGVQQHNPQLYPQSTALVTAPGVSAPRRRPAACRQPGPPLDFYSSPPPAHAEKALSEHLSEHSAQTKVLEPEGLASGKAVQGKGQRSGGKRTEMLKAKD